MPESAKAPAAKRTVSQAQYHAALTERDRLVFDLMMFVGLRASEVFGLRVGDIGGDTYGLNVRSTRAKSRAKDREESQAHPRACGDSGAAADLFRRLGRERCRSLAVSVHNGLDAGVAG